MQSYATFNADKGGALDRRKLAMHVEINAKLVVVGRNMGQKEYIAH